MISKIQVIYSKVMQPIVLATRIKKSKSIGKCPQTRDEHNPNFLALDTFSLLPLNPICRGCVDSLDTRDIQYCHNSNLPLTICTKFMFTAAVSSPKGGVAGPQQVAVGRSRAFSYGRTGER